MTDQVRDTPAPGRRSSVEGREVEFLDGMLPALYPRAKEGNPEAVDRVLKVLDLRLKYSRDRWRDEE